jgi:hypothetical protein
MLVVAVRVKTNMELLPVQVVVVEVEQVVQQTQREQLEQQIQEEEEAALVLYHLIKVEAQEALA